MLLDLQLQSIDTMFLLNGMIACGLSATVVLYSFIKLSM